jgi:hypothetical protein
MVVEMEKLTEENARSDAKVLLEKVFDETVFYFGIVSVDDYRRLKKEIIRSVENHLIDAGGLIHELEVWVENGYKLTRRDAGTYLASDAAIRLAMNRLGISSWVMSKHDALLVLNYADYILRKAEELVEGYAVIYESMMFGWR